MTKISKDDVLRLARLSKIKLADDQLDKLAEDMNNITDYVQLLNEVDTKNVKPTAQVSGLENVSRKDEVIDYGVAQAELLKNVSDSKNGLMKVPKVL